MRRIILLDKIDEPNGDLHFRYALWLDVPVPRQPAYAARQAGFVSAVLGAAAPDATEQARFEGGQMTEVVDDGRWNSGTTVAAIQAILVTRLNQMQAWVNSDAPNVWRRYGTFYDDATSTWTARNTA